jgi:hypothetical protein
MTLTVAEVIDKLRELAPDLPFYIYDGDEHMYAIEKVEVEGWRGEKTCGLRCAKRGTTSNEYRRVGKVMPGLQWVSSAPRVETDACWCMRYVGFVVYWRQRRSNGDYI